MKIISLQISDDLLDRFEKVRNQSGFSSKSEALRDSILKFIESHEKQFYHKFHLIIKAITDWRIADKKIEIVLVVGEFGIIKDLYQALAKIKDVTSSIHEVIID